MTKLLARLKISPTLLIIILLAIFIFIAVFFRIVFPYNQIFVGDNIKYATNDNYLYMRLVDNVVAHFPHLTQFDPYYLYPGGINVTSLPFFHWMIAFFAWMFGGGNPSQHLVDIIGVYLPVILAALTIIPVFFIGRALWGKWAGVLAAGMIALLPGEYLSRTMLGATDNPVAEIFFTTTALAFLIYAIKSATQSQVTFSHILKRDWKVILKPLILSALAGIFLGFYLATWGGALLFVFIFGVYLLVQFIINQWHNKSNDYLGIIGFVTLLLAFLILLINPFTPDITAAMAIAIFIPLVLWGISKFVSARKWPAISYPAILVGLGVLVFVVMYFGANNTYDVLMAKFKFVFFPGGATAATTTEVFPLLIPFNDSFNTVIAFENFGTTFFIGPWWLLAGIGGAAIFSYFYYLNEKNKQGLSTFIFLVVSLGLLILLAVQQLPNHYSMVESDIKFIPGIAFISLSVLIFLFARGNNKEQPWYISVGWVLATILLVSFFMVFTTYQSLRLVALAPLAILIYVLFKQHDKDETSRLFILWTLVILMITMVQRRFGYYLAVNIAILTGFLAWKMIYWSGVKNVTTTPLELENVPQLSKAQQKKKSREKRVFKFHYINIGLAVLVVFFLVFCPTLSKAQGQSQQVTYAITDAWEDALLWMKDNTPEPLGDAAAYYKDYEALATGESFVYPSSVYSVLSWWDFGYWIMRVAHRIPNTNPSQGKGPIISAANYFLSQNMTAAESIRKQLGARYVISDYDMIIGKHGAIVDWAGQSITKYYEEFLVSDEQGGYFTTSFFYPAYYQSTLIRLYNFECQAVTSVNATVITFENVKDNDGNPFKLVKATKEFNDYQAAVAYAQKEGIDTHAIVSMNPFVSCVPLEALTNYKLVYLSAQTKQTQSVVFSPTLALRNDITPEVKIFEYTGGK